jgi:hypothetical protein
MQNQFCYYLNSPIKFKPPFFISDLPKESIYDAAILNPEFSNWLKIFRVKPTDSKVYYLWPESEEQNHLSAYKDISEYAEIKIIFSPAPCSIQWWSDDHELLYAADIDGLGKPIIVNTGLLHSVPKVESILWCFSFKLRHIKTNELIKWNKAVQIFNEYIE